MDREVIAAKLESLRRCIRRIEDKCPPNSEVLASDVDLQDIVSLNLSRAVQLCVDIASHIVASQSLPPPATMGQAFDLLAGQGLIPRDLAGRLRSAVGFRNIAVHNYEAINWLIVFSIATRHLSDFSEFAGAVVEWLDRGGPS